MTGGRDIISPLGCREVDEPVPDLDLQDEAVSGGRKGRTEMQGIRIYFWCYTTPYTTL